VPFHAQARAQRIDAAITSRADSALQIHRRSFIVDAIQEGLKQTAERSANLAKVFERRARIAQERFSERVAKAAKTLPSPSPGVALNPWSFWSDWTNYAVDSFQRSVLFLDTLRQRGNAYHEHEEAGRPPLLHFDHEMVLDARTFAQPVNYALVRIVPPHGVTVDPTSRPYVIIDPRAGHGPGIGGFKDDSQVGVALRAGIRSTS
jgi:hypothetical protein